MAEDNVESIENSILDKIGEKSVKWEYLGEMMDPKMNRITYEEVVDGTKTCTNKRRSLELRWQLEYEQSGKYTLNMVEIDKKLLEKCYH